MKKFIAFIFLIFSLFACRSTEHKYVTVEKGEDCCEIKVLVGNTDEKLRLNIVNNKFPIMEISYTSPTELAKNLKFIDAKLFIEGKEISPDGEEYTAAFFDAFRPQKYTPIAKKDCCENLEKTLQFDKKQNHEADLLGINISKSYESLKEMPLNVEVLMTAITDKGVFEKRWKLKLTTYERISDPIRFH